MLINRIFGCTRPAPTRAYGSLAGNPVASTNASSSHMRELTGSEIAQVGAGPKPDSLATVHPEPSLWQLLTTNLLRTPSF